MNQSIQFIEDYNEELKLIFLGYLQNIADVTIIDQWENMSISQLRGEYSSQWHSFIELMR